MSNKNIKSEIEEALEEGRRQGLNEAIELLRGLKQIKIPFIFQGIDRPCDAEGWSDLTTDEKKVVSSAAAALVRLRDNTPVPPCKHIWSDPPNQVCAICGTDRPETDTGE